MEIDFKDWFTLEGPMPQGEFVKRTLISIVGGLVLALIPVLGWLAALALGVMGILAAIRRLNAIGKSPWLALIFLIPVVGLIFLIWLLLQK